MNIFTKIKTSIGIDNTDESTESIEETGIEAMLNHGVEVDPYSGTNIDDNPIEGGIEREMPTNNFFPVIRKPREFDDCKTIALDIKANKMVTINIEELDSATAQNLMDFLAGAMSITGAKFVPINNTVYTIVPAGLNIDNDGRSIDNEKTFLEIKY
ncbi:cell division protein SepF [Fusobacterium sp. PH5-44]|uniref:cell division protein SepF n=1 Tax=unclassified Fusobacterium TaxID=2648384 RepID=UPI003D2590FD